MARYVSLVKDYLSWKYKLKTTFKNEKRVALASFPRSGNTWTRVLLEEATGELSGSIYDDRVFTRGREGVVIKTHARDSYKYNRAIVLLRHPLDAFVSHYKWRQNFGAKDHIDWDEHIDRCIKLWGRFYHHWSGLNYPVHTIRYEDLRTETELNLRKLLEFLDRPISETKLLEAIAATEISKMRRSSESMKGGKAFFNKGEINTGRKAFSDKELLLIRKNLGTMAQKYGYEI